MLQALKLTSTARKAHNILLVFRAHFCVVFFLPNRKIYIGAAAPLMSIANIISVVTRVCVCKKCEA